MSPRLTFLQQGALFRVPCALYLGSPPGNLHVILLCLGVNKMFSSFPSSRILWGDCSGELFQFFLFSGPDFSQVRSLLGSTYLSLPLSLPFELDPPFSFFFLQMSEKFRPVFKMSLWRGSCGWPLGGFFGLGISGSWSRGEGQCRCPRSRLRVSPAVRILPLLDGEVRRGRNLGFLRLPGLLLALVYWSQWGPSGRVARLPLM